MIWVRPAAWLLCSTFDHWQEPGAKLFDDFLAWVLVFEGIRVLWAGD